MARLELRLLGDCDARVGGGPALALPTRKARALLAVVAMAPQLRLPRERLCAMLWERSADEQARASLRQTLSSVRGVLTRVGADGVLAASREEVWLEADGCEVDALAFEAHVRKGDGQALAEAARLYRGDFLAGLSLREQAFEEWLEGERQRLRELARRALGRHLEDLIEQREHAGAVEVATRLLAIDPLQENAHRALMEIHAREGRRASALRQFESCRALLERELGVAPEGLTVALADQIRAQAGDAESAPAADLDEEATAQVAWSGEIRPVAVLYARLPAQESEAPLDLERHHERSTAFLAAVETVAGDFGGQLERRLGDSAIVLFGVPVTSGNDAERALRAALALRGCVPRAQVGVAGGQVVVGAGGQETTVTGDSVGLAQRLADAAAPGEILATEPAWQPVQSYIESEAVAGIAARAGGRASPARRILGPRRDPVGYRPTRFIGRGGEMRQLSALLAGCAEDGSGQVVYVRGEPGIGKTRLVEEAMARAGDLGYRVHLARVLDFGAGRRDELLCALLCGLLDLDTECAAAERQARANSTPEPGIDEAARPFLHDLLDLPQPPESRTLYEAMDESARQAGKRALVCDLLVAVSRQAPRLVVVEDVHWAGGEALADLMALTRCLPAGPVVLVITSRLEGDPLDRAWRAQTRGTPMLTLDLGPLREAEANELARQITEANEDVLRGTITRAEGNPLFLEQLLRMSREGGAADGVPDSVQALALARSDRLAPLDRAALQAASVLGQRFSMAALRHLLQRPDYRCATLVERDLVREGDESCLFSHALIREGVLASLLPSTRRSLHARAAEWFESLDPRLHAVHLEAAGDPGAARAWLDAASVEARAYRSARALEHIERGLAVCEQDEDRFALHYLQGELLLLVGPLTTAIEALRAAHQAAPDDIARCRALTSMAVGLRQVSEFESAHSALDAAEPIARTHGLYQELAKISITRGNLAFRLGHIDDCLPHQQRALDYARRAGSDELRIHALGGMGDAYYAMGLMQSAHDHLSRCVSEARQFGFGRIESAHRIMGTQYWQLEFDAAEGEALDALATATRVGSLVGELQACLIVAQVATARMALDRAAEYAARAVQLAEQLGAERSRARCLHYRARVHVAADEKGRALPLLAEALDLARRTGPGYCGPAIIGTLLLATDDPDQLRALLAEGEALLDRGAVAHNAQEFHTDAAELALRRGGWGEAERHAARLESRFRAEPTALIEFLVERARALAALGRDPGDAAALDRIRRLCDQARQTGFRLPLGPMERALAQPPRDD